MLDSYADEREPVAAHLIALTSRLYRSGGAERGDLTNQMNQNYRFSGLTLSFRPSRTNCRKITLQARCKQAIMFRTRGFRPAADFTTACASLSPRNCILAMERASLSDRTVSSRASRTPRREIAGVGVNDICMD